ncbi:MAG: hypothetical protein VXV82_05510 [Bacteroidota bacterium]|nr:hypothetical protein [Bacteroidota bacterium]MEC7281418.1 hypothetical protein [Verrucomicrobiota bacterium]
MLGGYMPENAHVEYDVNIFKGDLLQLKRGMMLVEPNGPVQVLEADNEKGIYEVRYLSSNYVVGCGRMDIEGHWN